MKERIRTLSNGLRVANFSSPHHFEFTDGTELPRVSKSTVERLSLKITEFPLQTRTMNQTTVQDIRVEFNLTPEIRSEMRKWENLWTDNLVDVVIIPLPMLKAMQEENPTDNQTIFRCIRLASREDKIVEIDKFTL